MNDELNSPQRAHSSSIIRHSSLPTLLTLGTRWTFVGGKGGVGKTTTAAALAISLADAGEEVLVLSVDPAHSLGDALGVALGSEPVDMPGVPRLRALEIDAAREQERFLGSHRRALLLLLERGTYLDREDIDSLVDLTLPGADEIAAVFRLLDLASASERHVVVDTAPTGHTLRLLDLPGVARGWLAALEAMEEKHRTVALGLVGAYRPDDAAALLGRLREELDELAAIFSDPERTRFVLVTNTEPVVLAETRRYEAALTERRIALAGIVVNRADAASLPPEAVGDGMVVVPRLPGEPRGPDGLRAFAASAGAGPGSEASTIDGPPELRAGNPFQPPLGRTLYVVGGKGGVGKSTVASALAVQLARRGGGRVLLLSVDPAGSLAEVLGVPVNAEARAVPGVEGLAAQQLEAESAWRSFQREYRAEAEQLFAGLMGGGGTAEADRRVVERLIYLAPPGIDELMTLVQVVELTEDRPYDAVVLDTAPAGHLLRLLELPAVALDWARAVLRMLLKYREVAGLGALAGRVLALTRDLRAVRELLQDPAATWLVAVALPESLSVAETRRLLSRLRGLGIAPGALLVNRALTQDGAVRGSAEILALRSLAEAVPFAGTTDESTGPVGPDALAAFASRWREIVPPKSS
ncbi:MAG: ArsA family ATPase [Gemmatimonadetes bacterium]|nr:ArsA family ATPase [Gemmatimonadota bacterium]